MLMAFINCTCNSDEILEVMKKINFKIFKIACFVLCFQYIVLRFLPDLGQLSSVVFLSHPSSDSRSLTWSTGVPTPG